MSSKKRWALRPQAFLSLKLWKVGEVGSWNFQAPDLIEHAEWPEAYLDVTENKSRANQLSKIARLIQHAIWEAASV